jgi:hypothetical protein
MAIVFLAQDLKHSRLVAVKVLNPELGTATMAERFFREIGIVARLAHPNILPLHDSGTSAGCLFFVTPYVEGESLRAWLDRERQLPIDVAVRLAGEVADALDYAHRQGVIHRDIKPDNILIADGHAIVTDFGIATALAADGSPDLTSPGFAVGTPRYMSPEQAIGSTVDGRSDIYSLAAVLYETIVGESPFTARAGGLPAPSRDSAAIHALRVTRPGVPEHVVKAIERGLASLPADRQGHAEEFKHDIQPGTHTQEQTRPRIGAWAVAAIVATSAAGLGLVFRENLVRRLADGNEWAPPAAASAPDQLRVLETYPTAGTALSPTALDTGIPLRVVVEHRAGTLPAGYTAELSMWVRTPCGDSAPELPDSASSCFHTFDAREASHETMQLAVEGTLHAWNVLRDTILVRVAVVRHDTTNTDYRWSASTVLVYPVVRTH